MKEVRYKIMDQNNDNQNRKIDIVENIIKGKVVILDIRFEGKRRFKDVLNCQEFKNYIFK